MDPLRALVLALALLGAAGCNLQALVIRAQTEATEDAAREKGLQLADPELAGPMLAQTIVTSEGELFYTPDYDRLLMSAIFANVGYGALWLQVEAGDAEQAGDFARVDHLNRRSSLIFARALTLAKRLLHLWDAGFEAAVAGGDDAFQQWVTDQFYEKKDADTLLIAATAYFAALIQSDEGLAAAVDLPIARAMVERSVELDPTLSGGQGLMMLGAIECTIPEAMGGRPKVGLRLMRRAVELAQGENYGVQLMMAQRCAVALQDRAMFERLLHAVIGGKDVAKYRLTNKIARHEAQLLLKQAPDLFFD